MVLTSKQENPTLMNAILNTIVYADVFDYPLTAAQIHRYLTNLSATPAEVSARLENLQVEVRVLRCQEDGDFYLLAGRQKILDTYRRRQLVATKLWRQALRYGHIIASLPFVRMLAVTGSLAMDNTEENGDIDFLIVTSHERVWLCRLLILGVVWLAARRKVKLCPNYLISERSLGIPTQNLYSAHELTQMVPLTGMEIYQQMRAQNSWSANFLPNAVGLPERAAPLIKGGYLPGLRKLLEIILLSPIGTRLEHFEMRRKIQKFSREHKGNSEALFSADMCKGHFNRHGQRTEKVLNERLVRLSQRKLGPQAGD